MGKKDKRIDTYISKSANFAQPILKHLRELIHRGCPEVVETLKWGMPAFDYKGPLFSFAAFKQHASAGFWKSKLLKDPKGYIQLNAMAGGAAMGHFGKLSSLKDLPPDKVIIDFFRQAMRLNEQGVKVPVSKTKKPEVEAPGYFLREVRRNNKALATFEAFPPSHRREYIEWIVEAKTEETRNKRMSTAIAWMAEGQPRNWKYMKKSDS